MADLMTKTTVTLVRHGQSTYNLQGRYQGRCDDSVLTEKGEQDAKLTGLALQQTPIDAVYASPLQRTQQTAKIILTQLHCHSDRHVPLYTRDRLREIHLALWEGLPFKTVQKEFAEDFSAWKHHPHEFKLKREVMDNPAGEKTEPQYYYPVLDLYQQAQQFWQDILTHHLGQQVLVVAHGGTNRALISVALGLPPSQFHSLQQSNCGISRVQFNSSQFNSGQLTALNLTNHLGETLPKLKAGKAGLRLLLLSESNLTPPLNQALAAGLKTIKIDFSLNPPHLGDEIKTILTNHPQMTSLQIQQNQGDLVWQQVQQISQSFLESNSEKKPRLLTGLLVMNQQITDYFIEQVLKPNLSQISRFEWEPGRLQIIHFPVGHPPILQAQNYSTHLVCF